MWRSNVQDVRKLVFRCASESLYICLVFFLELRRIIFDPSTLIDILRVKTSRYVSPGKTRRAPKQDPNLGQEAAQGSVQQQDIEHFLHRAPGTECAFIFAPYTR